MTTPFFPYGTGVDCVAPDRRKLSRDSSKIIDGTKCAKVRVVSGMIGVAEAWVKAHPSGTYDQQERDDVLIPNFPVDFPRFLFRISTANINDRNIGLGRIVSAAPKCIDPLEVARLLRFSEDVSVVGV